MSIFEQICDKQTVAKDDAIMALKDRFVVVIKFKGEEKKFKEEFRTPQEAVDFVQKSNYITEYADIVEKIEIKPGKIHVIEE